MENRKPVMNKETLPNNLPRKKTAQLPNKDVVTERVISDIINIYALKQVVADDKDENSDPEALNKKKSIKAKEIKDFVTSLDSKETLITMLATQMKSIQDLQEFYFMMAKVGVSKFPLEAQQYYANTLIKLSNVLIQQATLMHKLQGHAGQQKVIVEHVHVHNGGQAIVGNIQSNAGGRGDGKEEN